VVPSVKTVEPPLLVSILSEEAPLMVDNTETVKANEDIKFDHTNPILVFENSKPVGWLCDTPGVQIIVNEDDDDCIKVRKDPSPVKKRVAKAQSKSDYHAIIGD